MATVKAIFDKVNALDLRAKVPEIIEDAHEELEEWQRKQMLVGRRKDGGDILPDYAPLTISIKQKKGQETRWVTLEDTGEFQRKIRASVEGDRIKFDSSDWKTDELKEKYTDLIFGLESEVLGEFTQTTFKPALAAYIFEVTGLK